MYADTAGGGLIYPVVGEADAAGIIQNMCMCTCICACTLHGGDIILCMCMNICLCALICICICIDTHIYATMG